MSFQLSTIRFVILPCLPPLTERGALLEQYKNLNKVKKYRACLNHTVKTTFFKNFKNLPPISSSVFLVNEGYDWQLLAMDNRLKDLVISPKTASKDQLFVLIRKQLIGLIRPERQIYNYSTMVVEKTNLSCSLLDFLDTLDWSTLMNLQEFKPTRYYIKRKDSTYARIDQDSKLKKGERVVAGTTFKYIDQNGTLQEYQVPIDLTLHELFQYCKFDRNTPKSLYTLFLDISNLDETIESLDVIETYSNDEEDDGPLFVYWPHKCAFISDDDSVRRTVVPSGTGPLTMVDKIGRYFEKNQLSELLNTRTQILEMKQKLLQTELLHHRNVVKIFQGDVSRCHIQQLPGVDWKEMEVIANQQQANAQRLLDVEVKLNHEIIMHQETLDTFNQHILNQNRIFQSDRLFVMRDIIDE